MKPALALTEQVGLLVSRGLSITDAALAEKYLYDTNYYRLSGYARQFQCDPRNGDNTFTTGCSLALLSDIVHMDASLSIGLFGCLTILEKTVRSRFAYELAQSEGNQAFYLDPGNYLAGPQIDAFPEKLESELRRAQSPTVAHYVRADGSLDGVPVWVAFELLSFGSVSRILEYYANPAPGHAVAASFSEERGTFPSTIHSLAVLRNKCAHHGQLWHRRLSIHTPVKRKDRRHAPPFDPQGVYPAVLALHRLLRSLKGGAESLDALERTLDQDSVFLDGILNPQPRF